MTPWIRYGEASLRKQAVPRKAPWCNSVLDRGSRGGARPSSVVIQAPGIAAVIVGLSQPSPTDKTQLCPLVSEASTVQLP